MEFTNGFNLSINEQERRCVEFFQGLYALLKDDYDIRQTRSKPFSACLIPKGTDDRLTYSSKPELSFRAANTWNWHTTVKKNPDPSYIQCYTKDLPSYRRREEGCDYSKPVWAWSVCLFVGNEYHVIFGEKYNRSTKKWTWIEKDPNDIFETLAKLNLIGGEAQCISGSL